MAEAKLRLNLDTESVEFVVNGSVAMETGSEVFKNWVEAYNSKHKVIEDKVVEPDAPVEEKVVPTEDTKTVDDEVKE